MAAMTIIPRRTLARTAPMPTATVLRALIQFRHNMLQLGDTFPCWAALLSQSRGNVALPVIRENKCMIPQHGFSATAQTGSIDEACGRVVTSAYIAVQRKDACHG